jgi:hypothetical protein
VNRWWPDVLTLAHNYYENAGMLARHIENWRSYDPAVLGRVRFLVMDDGSPSAPALPVVRETGAGLPITVYRIKEDIPWNWDGARNLAMHVAETEWVWLLDSDRLVEHVQAARALRLKKEPGKWYRPNQRFTDGTDLKRPHPNCYIVSKTDFWKTGGHDEDFVGFYDKDKPFFIRLSSVAIPVFVPEIHMTAYRREDVADCDTRMGRKHSPYHLARAPAHILAKAKGSFYVAVRPMRFTWERQN